MHSCIKAAVPRYLSIVTAFIGIVIKTGVVGCGVVWAGGVCGVGGWGEVWCGVWGVGGMV